MVSHGSRNLLQNVLTPRWAYSAFGGLRDPGIQGSGDPVHLKIDIWAEG